ncbi:MAG TPA: hypothetical protein VIJ65_03510 [Acidobacteriaceae bacterium]
MNVGVLLAAALWMAAPSPAPAQAGPEPQIPLRDAFVVAAETVIDDAGTTDVKADDAHFAGQMTSLKEAQANLAAMADVDREHTIADAMKDIVFQVASCHIQSIDGADTTKCQSQIETARKRAMQTINKHKSGSSWVDGPPSN